MNTQRVQDLEDFVPEWDAPNPGTLIQRELDATGRTQADLADRMSISKKHLNQVIKGASLTPEFSLAIERALGIDARLLLRMEAEWRAARLIDESRASLAQHVGWVNTFKGEDVRRGITHASDDQVTRVEKLLRFFGVSDPAAYDRTWLKLEASFKRSSAFNIDEHATALWIQLAVRQADAIAADAPDYDAGKLRIAAKKLPSLTLKEPEAAFVELQQELLGAGVILVYVEEMPDTRVSGVSLWLPNDRPMIAVTGRYKFADSLWFAIAHEIAHVLHHLKRTTFLEISSDEMEERFHHGDAADHQETQANTYASNLLLAGLSEAELRSVATKEELLELAGALHVSPGVLAGQYAHLTNDWAKFGKLRTKADLSSLP
ncbi:helix-turn-helix domain-containing protein [Microbacterium rhizosphaerae]|uniref:Helix-turn-helix domain-containing protein n=1 Tax=Microbacterium rhizosphaerae TaxID=1678237 RepID=A0ABZ0SNY6_9MICO|nr:helix-turn-helix domain-containing protein [Microbacterium rhizosphaerae]WPR90195.1 helix-turn-helix domain-containing protein [Microbacterium rhizosphaerae]